MRGVVLAAGDGGRLRPLTDRQPKVLLPVRGRPLISYPLGRHRADWLVLVMTYWNHMRAARALAIGVVQGRLGVYSFT